MSRKTFHLGSLYCIAFVLWIGSIALKLPTIEQRLIIIYYLAINGITLLFTWQDKRAAINKRNRISELRFYVLALFGGWIGGYLGQRWQRHKTQKQPFRVIYWSSASLHTALTITVIISV